MSDAMFVQSIPSYTVTFHFGKPCKVVLRCIDSKALEALTSILAVTGVDNWTVERDKPLMPDLLEKS